MQYWLVKTEPTTYSISDLAKEKVTAWDHVRNYQARNYLKQMEVGDVVLVYHSSCDEPGVVGEAEVSKVAYPDKSQFDKKSDYYDPTASKQEPRWWSPDIRFKNEYRPVIKLDTLKKIKGLADMVLLKRGNRLSVMPVTAAQYKLITSIEK